MPTPPGFADCSLEFQHTLINRPAYITFGVDPVATDPSQVATSIHLAYTNAGSLNSLLDSGVTMTAIRVSLGTDGSEDLVYVASYTTTGGKGLTSLPPNNAALIHKTTARGGRRGRGRLFLPWMLGNADVGEGGAVVSSVVTAINAACQVFLTQLSVQTVPMVLLHGAGQSAPGAPNTVLTLMCDRVVSTQRRRLGR